MLTANLPLDDSSGDEITFNLQTYLPDGARRINSASTLTDKKYLEIRHTSSGQGTGVVDRHLISAYAVKQDVAGAPHKGTVNLTFSNDRSGTLSDSDMLDLCAALIDLITDGGFSGSGFAGTTNASAIFRGES